MARVLVVDDEPVFVTSLGLILVQEGYEVRTAGDAQEAIAEATAWPPDVLVADWMFRDGPDGIELAAALRNTLPELRLILITGYAAREVRQRLMALPGAKLLEKPFLPEQLLDMLRECLA